MSDWQGSLESFGHDLLNRQINLIVTPGGVVGSSVPSTRQALHDIATTYARHLGTANDPKCQNLPSSKIDGDLQKYQDAFAVMHGVANVQYREERRSALADRSLRTDLQTPEVAAQRLELRVGDHTAKIANILSHTTSLDAMAPREISAIQKIWEIGTDNIVLQTTISIGGDVLTRIHADYTTPAAQSLWQLHQQSVDASSSSWKDLIDSAVALFSQLFSKI